MKILTVLAAILGGASAVVAGPLLRIQDLGTLGGSQMSGMAISSSGQIAGYGSDAFGNLRAFTATSSFADLTPVGTGSAAAYGVNGSGQVVGRMLADGNSQATLWSHGTAQQLGGLGGPDSYANGINDNQQIAGMATDASGRGRAVVYSGGGVQDVSLPGSNWSSAYAINNSGMVAGYSMNGAGLFQAYSWSPTSGFASLGTLGGRNSYAFGINNAGQIAGNSNVASGYSHAFRSDDGTMHDLGTLGGTCSFAYGINNSGAIVGSSWLADETQTHAFLYLAGAMIDLNALVANLGGWELTEAYAVNDAGQIAGTGLLNGVEHAFRLDPMLRGFSAKALSSQAVPEPGTMGLWLLGGVMLAGLRLRRLVRKSL